MLDFSCLPCTALQVSLYAYGRMNLAKLGLGAQATALQQESNSEVTTLEEKSTLSAIQPELLVEIVAMLPCSVLECALPVSRLWHETLNNETLWERMCRAQWPGVVTPRIMSWHKFAMRGGGDLLGTSLLHHLQHTDLACNAKGVAQCCLAESQDMRCDACDVTNPHGMRVQKCRTCKYTRCDKCYKALQPPASITNGAVNHNSKNGLSALHYACRLGFENVVNKLLDAQANVENRDHHHGFTPLMVGASYGHEKICSLLLERGAAKESINDYGQTAAKCAISWGHADLGKLLMQSE